MAYVKDPNSDERQLPIQIDGWPKGIDNLRRTYDLAEGALRDAINVDISNSGKARRRDGYASHILGAMSHSLYATDKWMANASAGVLYIRDANTTEISQTPVNPMSHIAYQTVNGDTYCTNGFESLIISSTGTISQWGVDNPAFQPTLTEMGGSLFAGTYQVAITYISATGEESGTGKAATTTVVNNAGIAVSGFPAFSGSNIDRMRVYVSYPDGGELFLYGEYPTNVASVMVSSARLGPVLRTQFLSRVPPGKDITYSQGRLIVSSGSMIFFTQPLRYGLYNNTADFGWYPAPVTLVWGAFDGVYVATTEETYFVTGLGTPEQKQDLVLPTGAVPGTKADMPDKTGCMWVTPKGVVKAFAGGKIENVSYDKVSIGEYQSGAAVVREDDGLRRYISSVNIPREGTQFATRDFFDAEVVRP